jgi:hypothetical protein
MNSAPGDLLDEHDLSCARLVFDYATVIPREYEGSDPRAVVGLTRWKQETVHAVGKRGTLSHRQLP